MKIANKYSEIKTRKRFNRHSFSRIVELLSLEINVPLSMIANVYGYGYEKDDTLEINNLTTSENIITFVGKSSTDLSDQLWDWCNNISPIK